MKQLGLAIVFGLTFSTVNANDFALGGNIGTPGAGLQATVGLTDTLNARGVINYFSADTDESQDGIDYELDFDLQSFGAILDWHPSGGTFRLSVGLFSNGNELTGSGRGTPGTLVEFGDQVFPADELGTVNAELDFDSAAPYLGIGWGNAVKEPGWSFAADIGVFFQGDPDVRLMLTDVNPLIADEAEAERAQAEAELRDEVDSFDLYPYLSIGAAYRF